MFKWTISNCKNVAKKKWGRERERKRKKERERWQVTREVVNIYIVRANSSCERLRKFVEMLYTLFPGLGDPRGAYLGKSLDTFQCAKKGTVGCKI